MKLTLTLPQVKNLLLAVQNLHTPPQKNARKADVLASIQSMGALQIDTIHVVARSPYLVLWSRLGAYAPHWLEELLAEGAVFEYWSHAACFLPIEEFPLYRRFMLENRRGWGNNQAWLDAHPALVQDVIEQIQNRGALRSADFAPKNPAFKSDGWWDWKDEKITLDRLHTAGKLMVRARKNFQRIYDLTERVLPDWDDREAPSYETALATLTEKTLRSLGAAPAAWVSDYFRLPKTGLDKRLQALIHQGRVQQIGVEGWDEPFYLHSDHRPLAEAAANGQLESQITTLLSPFDPVIWDRKRTRALFGVDFSIECYLPAEKRKYGYFALPLLHRGTLAARLDAKAHRKEGLFEIRSFHLENGTILNDRLISETAASLQACAAWHQTPQVILGAQIPAPLRHELNRALGNHHSDEGTQ